jgi:RHS repeat-associated protein
VLREGEVRYTTASSTLPTRYTFTGQRSYMDDITTAGITEGFGLMFYNARWYDPALGRMAQADSIIPGGVQGLDRYAYVNNSPVNFTDPSGHKICTDDGYCGSYNDYSYQKHMYTDAITNVYKWKLKGRWSLKELKTIYDTGYKIQSYVDKLTGGKGLAWMNKYLGGITLAHTDESPLLPLRNRGHAWDNTIFLPMGWESGGYSDPMEIFAHELGHIWDQRTSTSGFVGGVGDNLNTFMGGFNLPFFRWLNLGGTDPRLNSEYLFREVVREGWGNGCPADYLAETFGWSIFNPSSVPGSGPDGNPARGTLWINAVIFLEAEAMP